MEPVLLLSNYKSSRLPPYGEMSNPTISGKTSLRFFAVVEYEDDYVQPMILAALASRLPQGSYWTFSSTSEISKSTKPVLHISSYERLLFDDILAHPDKYLSNAYIIRKALIRKHHLGATTHEWLAKHPSSILATNFKPSNDFELDYAEFLDDALDDYEAVELQASCLMNEDKDPKDREWWILKPGMSDRGQGIRLFSTRAELQSIFDKWESENPESDDEEDGKDDSNNDVPGNHKNEESKDFIMTSHLRHFVTQEYIHPPLLLAGNPHKFHIRTYVVAVGSLKVYVYRPMLALFASTPYTPPWTSSSPEEIDLTAHLTNTCLQNGTSDRSVQAFWSLPCSQPSLSSSDTWKEDIFKQICSITGEIFEAAARGQMIHFQTLPNAFEIFGLDFLVDGKGLTWLLEVNAFPDFKQTGEELSGLIQGLWNGVVDVAVAPFFKVEQENLKRDNREDGEQDSLVLVRDLDLGRS